MHFKTFLGAAAAASLLTGAALADGERSETVLIINGERVEIPSGEQIEVIVSNAMEGARAAIESGRFDMDIDVEIDGERFEGSDPETLDRAMSAVKEAMGELEREMPGIERELQRVEIELRDAFADLESDRAGRRAILIERQAVETETADAMREAAREARAAAENARVQARIIARDAASVRASGLAAGMSGIEAGLQGLDEALSSGMVDSDGRRRPMTQEERERIEAARAELESALEGLREQHGSQIRREIRILRETAPDAERIEIRQQDGRTRYFRNGEELTGDELTAFLNERQAERLAGAPDPD